MTASRVAVVKVVEVEKGASDAHASGVVEIVLKDGREFSVLAATPSWFQEALSQMGLPFYFGAAVLFLKRMTPAFARKAAEEMASGGDRWLCVYDTPRTTLRRVLGEFKARHH